jgi:hypothetical protein
MTTHISAQNSIEQKKNNTTVCFTKNDWWGREVVVLRKIKNQLTNNYCQLTELGEKKSQLNIIESKFKSLGFDCIFKNQGIKTEIYLPAGWKVEKSENFTDLSFLYFIDPKGFVRANIRCKEAPHEAYYRVDFYRTATSPAEEEFLSIRKTNSLASNDSAVTYDDILLNIFKYLDKKSLYNASLVSKEWQKCASYFLTHREVNQELHQEMVRFANLFDVCAAQVNPKHSPYLTRARERLLSIKKEDLSKEDLKQIFQKKKENFLTIFSNISTYFEVEEVVAKNDKLSESTSITVRIVTKGANETQLNPMIVLPKTFTMTDFKWLGILSNVQCNSSYDILVAQYIDELETIIAPLLNKGIEGLYGILTIINTIPPRKSQNQFFVDITDQLKTYLETNNPRSSFDDSTMEQNFSRALEQLHVNREDDLKSATLGYLARLMAKVNLLDALYVTLQIWDMEMKSLFIGHFAHQLVETKPSLALSAANMIPLKDIREKALGWIALVISKKNLEEGYQIADSITGEYKEHIIANITKDKSLGTIKNELKNNDRAIAYFSITTAFRDPQKAFATLTTITSAKWKDYALISFVKIFVGIYPEWVTKLAEMITDPVHKMTMLNGIKAEKAFRSAKTIYLQPPKAKG